MFKNKNFQSGFTLIEIVVVIGIMGVLMAIAIPSEISYRHKAELKTSVKELRSLYWDAQSRSLAPRQKDVGFYEIAVIKQTPPLSQTIFTEKECIDNINCPADIGQVTLGNNIYVSDIKCATGPTTTTTSLATYFAVGDNKTSGTMDFYETVGGSPINCDKIEIIMSSIIVSDYEFKITLDRTSNSIDYAKI
jgi:prepilin-type N-terminal cleavage/methylation domain-containing protein